MYRFLIGFLICYDKLFCRDIPNDLVCLNKLEKALISKRLLFKKIVITPKGQIPKISGAICNIPVSVEDTCSLLPRDSNLSGIILVKLKKKLSFAGHFYFELVDPRRIDNALIYLKKQQ